MKLILSFTLLVLGGFLFAPEALSQPALDLERLDSYFSEAPKVEVNMNKALIQLALEDEHDPEERESLERLNGIIVREYALSSALVDIEETFSSIGDDLEVDGWQVVVRVRDAEDGEHTWIYTRENPSEAGGLVVMTLDEEDDEATFVMMDGPFDPSDFGGIQRWMP